MKTRYLNFRWNPSNPALMAGAAIWFCAPLVWGQSYAFTTIGGRPGYTGLKDGTNSAYLSLNPLFSSPQDLAVADDGQIYVADTGNRAIRRMTRIGTNWVTRKLPITNAPPGALACTGIAIDAATNLYLADFEKAVVWRATQTGTNWALSLIAGSLGQRAIIDGTNGEARFNAPCGLALDRSGSIYVAEFTSHLVRKTSLVGTNWVVSTLAGMAGVAGSADGPDNEARFNGPNMVAVDAVGNLYVADTLNSTIRKITPVGTNWVVSTVLGLAGVPGNVDGTNNEVRLSRPYGVKVDTFGNLVIADTFNHTVRRAMPVGTDLVLTTIGGRGAVGVVDGVGTNAAFHGPSAVASDATGDSYVADTFNHTIRMGDADPLALRIGVEGSTALVAWPTWATNFTLERSDSLSPGAVWTAVTEGIEFFDSGWCKTNDSSAGSAFFRLRRQ